MAEVSEESSPPVVMELRKVDYSVIQNAKLATTELDLCAGSSQHLMEEDGESHWDVPKVKK